MRHVSALPEVVRTEAALFGVGALMVGEGWTKGIEAKRMMEYQKDSLLDWSRGKVVCASSKGA